MSMRQNRTLIIVLVFARISTNLSMDDEPGSSRHKLGFFDNMKLSTNIWSTSTLMSTANDYADRNDYRTAITFVSRAIDRKRHKVSYYITRAEFKMKLGKYKEAFEDLEKAYDTMKRQTALSDNSMQLDYSFTAPSLAKYGNQFMQWQEYECAIWFYSKVIDMRVNDPSHHVQRGKCYLEIGNTYAAIIDFEEALRRNSHNRDLSSLLDQAYFKVMREMDKLNTERVIHVADSLARKRKFNEAILCYDEAIQRQSESVTRPVTKTPLSIEMDRKRSTGSAEYHKKRGICYQEIGDFDAAIRDYDEYLRTSPDDVNMWRQLIELCSATDKLDFALRALRTLDVKRLVLVTQCYEDRCELAIPLLTLVIEKDSFKAEYYRKRGRCFAKMKDFNTAILDFELATGLELKNRQDAANLFHLLYDAGRYDDAIKEIEVVDDHHMLGKFCDRFEKDENFDGAIKCYNAVINKYPKCSVWLKARAECFRKLKMFEKAVIDFMEAAELDPGDMRIQEDLDRVLLEQEQTLTNQNPEPVLDMVVFDPNEQATEDKPKEVKKLYSNKYLEDLMLLDISRPVSLMNTAEDFHQAEPSHQATRKEPESTQNTEPEGPLDLISFTTSYPAPGYVDNKNTLTSGWELVPVNPFDTNSQVVGNDFDGTQGMALVPVNPFLTNQTIFGNENIGTSVSGNPFLTDERTIGTETAGNGAAGGESAKKPSKKLGYRG